MALLKTALFLWKNRGKPGDLPNPMALLDRIAPSRNIQQARIRLRADGCAIAGKIVASPCKPVRIDTTLSVEAPR